MNKTPSDSIPGPKPLILAIYENPMGGEAIEARSFEIIDQEVQSGRFARDEWHVVRRMLHATADFGLIDVVRFSPDAIDAAVAALRKGRPIFVDSNMIRSGISLGRLRKVCPDYDLERLVCHVADEDVANQARASGLPRSVFAVRKAVGMLHGSIAVFGNAPLALMELNRLIVEVGVKPELVIAAPVGFVHVIESKEELMSLDVPYVAVAGRRGGSPLAVSVLHALCSLATGEEVT